MAAALVMAAAGPAVTRADPVSDWLQIALRDGTDLAGLALPAGSEFCLTWFHSVTGGPVADCFANRAGVLMLKSSFLHDYAAGLGDLPGRGRLRPVPGGGYLIEDMDEPMDANRLHLRIAAPRVAQALRGSFGWLTLWPLAARGERVTIALIARPDAPDALPILP